MILHQVRKEIVKYLKEKYQVKNPEFQLMSARSLEDGDFFTNVALKYAKDVDLSPLDFAKEIQKILEKKFGDDLKIVVKEPGFVNFFAKSRLLLKELQNILIKKSDYGKPRFKIETISAVGTSSVAGKNITVEFSDPNPFKEFHIGHLMSNTIGESISRLLEYAGANVRRVCYQGDVGMHVAKSIWGLLKRLSEEKKTLGDLEKLNIEERLNYLGKSYALGANAYKEDAAKKEIEELNYLIYVVSQEDLIEKENWKPQVEYSKYLKDTRFAKNVVKEAYIKGREWSLEYFDKLYKILGTSYSSRKDFYFESEVGEYGLKIVMDYLEEGVFIKDKGAIIFPGENYGLHNRVFVNSKGLPTYEAKELGLAPKKYRDEPYDISIIITGNEIDEYFKVLIKALSIVAPALAKKTLHVSHGMMRLKGVGKMSSRSGKIVTAVELIEVVKKAVRNVMQFIEGDKSQLYPDLGQEVSVISDIAVGAIKFSILKVSLGKNIEFDFDASISIQGNSGPYVQYTYARARSVLRKSKVPPIDNKASAELAVGSIPNLNNDELTLMRTLIKFPEAVERATVELAPHYICHYLFALAQAFNTFYNSTPILNSPSEEFRLALSNSTAQVLKNGSKLLGIKVPERM